MPIPGASPVDLGTPVERPRIEGASPITPPSPTFGQRARAFGQGAVSGVTDALPIVGGAAGAILSAPTGPGGMAAGTALGIGAGEAGRRIMRENFGAPEVEDLPAEQRPFGFAGQVLGGGMVPAAAPVVAGQLGARFAAGAGQQAVGRVGNFLNRIIDTATRRPGAFLATEAAVLGSAGAAEGIAETVRPGETGVRLASGVAAGIASPYRFITQGMEASGQAISRAVRSISPQARENEAVRTIQRVVAEAGEDWGQIVQALRREDLSGANLTAAQLTGSPALASLEARLSRDSSRFGEQTRQRAQEGLDGLRRTIGALENTGDPALLQAAAQARTEYVRSLVEGEVSMAARQVEQVAQRIQPSTVDERGQVSARGREIVESALGRLRQAEREAWSRVPDDVPAEPTGFIATHNDIRASDLLPEESMPAIVTGVVNRAQDGQEIPLRQLQLTRSRLLNMSRNALSGESRDPNMARIYGRLAESLLDDMQAAVGDDPSLATARTLSREINDAFTRTFAGRAEATRQSGALRVPPEVFMEEALGTGRRLADLRFQELERAVRLGSPEAAEEMMNTQRRVLEIAAEELFDPETGQVRSARQLANFRRNNAPLLQRFSEVDEILRDAGTASEYFRDIQQNARGVQRAIERSALSRVANAENPTAEVGRLLAGPTPQRSYMNLVRAAERSGEDAVSGLRRATLDYVYDRAGGNDNFSFTAYRRALMEPRRAGEPSVLDTMRRNNVISADQRRQIEDFVTRAGEIERAMTTRTGLEQLLEGEDIMFNTVLRFAGAGLGSAAYSASPMARAPGGGIVAAGAGSRFARQVMEKIPAGRTRDAVQEMMLNPRLLAASRVRPRNEREAIRLGRQIHAYLWQAGLVQEGAAGEIEARTEPTGGRPPAPDIGAGALRAADPSRQSEPTLGEAGAAMERMMPMQ